MGVFYVFTKQFYEDMTRVLKLLNQIKRVQEELKIMATNEQAKVEELIAELESTTEAVTAVEQAIDGLLTVVENASDVSPEVQSAIDKVRAVKSRIAAAALKGTTGEPVDPQA